MRKHQSVSVIVGLRVDRTAKAFHGRIPGAKATVYQSEEVVDLMPDAAGFRMFNGKTASAFQVTVAECQQGTGKFRLAQPPLGA